MPLLIPNIFLIKCLNIKHAQTKLDEIAPAGKKKLIDKQAELDKMYKDYDAEQVMLSDDLKKKEKMNFYKRKRTEDLQRNALVLKEICLKKDRNLIKPIQDKVYNAVQKIAVARGYDFIFDKSEGITVIFADPKLDKSDDVLRELGIK